MRLYLLLGLLIGSLVLLVYVRELERDTAIAEANLANVKKADALASLKQLQEWNASESANRSDYLQQLKDAKHEIQNLERDLANNTKRLSVNAICPRLPQAESTGGVTEQTAELSSDAERTYIRLREQIAEQEAWISLCHKTVMSWASE